MTNDVLLRHCDAIMDEIDELFTLAYEFCWEGYYEDLLDLIDDNDAATLQKLGCITKVATSNKYITHLIPPE